MVKCVMLDGVICGTLYIPICILYIPICIRVVYYIYPDLYNVYLCWYTSGILYIPMDNCHKDTRPIFISSILQMLQRCQEIQPAACFWQETQSFSIMWHCCDIWDVSNIPNSTGFGISLTMYDISDANVTQWLVFSSSILWHLLCVKYTKLDRSWHRHIYIYHMHILKVEDTSLKVRKAKFCSKIRNFLCLVSAFASRSHICS